MKIFNDIISHSSILIKRTLNFRIHKTHTQTFFYEILSVKISHYNFFLICSLENVMMDIFFVIFDNYLFMFHKEDFYYLLN